MWIASLSYVYLAFVNVFAKYFNVAVSHFFESFICYFVFINNIGSTSTGDLYAFLNRYLNEEQLNYQCLQNVYKYKQ